MQEGRKCIFVILREEQFCGQISFVFHCISLFFDILSCLVLSIKRTRGKRKLKEQECAENMQQFLHFSIKRT